MENIPRLPARPPAFAARAYNTPFAGVARMNVNANTRGGRLTLYDVTPAGLTRFRDTTLQSTLSYRTAQSIFLFRCRAYFKHRYITSDG